MLPALGTTCRSLSFAPRRRRSCCAGTAESACGLAFEHALPRSRHGRAVVAQGRRRHVARVRGRRARRAVRAPPPCGTSDAAWSGHVVTTTQSLSHVTSRCRPCTSYPSLLPLRRSTRACSAASVCFSSARRSVVVHARNHNGKRSQRLAQITNLISTEPPRASRAAPAAGSAAQAAKAAPAAAAPTAAAPAATPAAAAPAAAPAAATPGRSDQDLKFPPLERRCHDAHSASQHRCGPELRANFGGRAPRRLHPRAAPTRSSRT